MVFFLLSLIVQYSFSCTLLVHLAIKNASEIFPVEKCSAEVARTFSSVIRLLSEHMNSYNNSMLNTVLGLI